MEWNGMESDINCLTVCYDINLDEGVILHSLCFNPKIWILVQGQP
jgi:hypothetical protein